MSQIGQFDPSSVLPTVLTLTADSGTNPVPPTGGTINVLGGANINTVGDSGLSTVTFNLDADVDTNSYSTLAGSPTEAIDIQANQISAGGSDANVDIDFTPKGTGNVNVLSGTLSIASLSTGVVLSNGFGDLSSTNGTDGQLLIGATGASPAWADLTSTGSTITITPGANTLNIETAGTISDSFPTDSGTATPSAGELDILGGSNINTAGATNQVTVNLDNTVTISGSFSTTGGAVNVGTATPGNPYDIAVEQTVNGLIGQSIQNLSAGASAGVNLQMIGEVGAADLFNLYSVNGATTWSTGIDNSDSDSFKFTTGSSPSGGTEAVVLTTAGVVNFPQYGAGAILSTSAGVLSSDNGTSGQVLTANGAGSIPTWEDNISFTWQEETGTSATMAVNNGYIANNGSLVTLTLPDTATLGSVIEVVGKGSGGWRIAQNAGESIIWNSTTATTTGVAGYLEFTDQYDAVKIVCTVADTTWTVLSSKGNITIN